MNSVLRFEFLRITLITGVFIFCIFFLSLISIGEGQTLPFDKSPLSILNQSSSLRNDEMHITGQLRNLANEIFYYVTVLASFYDQAGNFLGSNSTYAEPKTISPGSLSNFDLAVNGPSIKAGNGYTLIIAWQNPDGTSSHLNVKSQAENSKLITEIPVSRSALSKPIDSHSMAKREYTPFNVTYLGTIGSLGSTPGKFFHPSGAEYLSLNDKIYVADTDNNRIQIFDSNGHFISSWGATAQEFGHPEVIAIDSIKGFVYVSDIENNRIQKFDTNGSFVIRWGSAGNRDGQFNHPGSIAVDSEDKLLFVTDIGNHRIQKFDLNGNFISTWGTLGKEDGQFDRPAGITYDGTQKIIYVADTNNNRIQKFNTNGTFLGKWDSLGTSEGQFNNPDSITYDKYSGLLYISDLKNKRILVFTEDGLPFYQLDLAQLTRGLSIMPRDVTIDSAGKLFVVDKVNNKIHVFRTIDQSGSESIPGFRMYENDIHKVRIGYPSNWKQIPKSMLPADSIARFIAPGTGGETKPTGVLISIFQRPNDSNLDDFIDFFHNSRYAKQSDFTIVNSSETTLAGIPAREIILYEQKDNVLDPKSDLKVMRVYAFDDKTHNGYTIRYYSEPGLFNKYLPTAQKMVHSFKVTSRT